MNGKRNGKLKEYDKNGNLIFEGEYVNDTNYIEQKCDSNNNAIFWKEKEFNQIIFEGKYLNRKRRAKGKEFSYNWNLIFDGE